MRKCEKPVKNIPHIPNSELVTIGQEGAGETMNEITARIITIRWNEDKELEMLFKADNVNPEILDRINVRDSVIVRCKDKQELIGAKS